ncbi:hypothetical protein PACTADRAFT_49403 [Pachysolen tannophilus NRRL Y-2460]|uniref:37S ribosomal protein S25, mitochondrial n=1 Tax=Pachysolen tannophilus NRRL Y-2460 TaxID=669874 RepID=A0A1E4TWD9_PACTA|nr:hypothetical protein PACTADRAFT_49403 [Pachysolen tannophilus NRRL Y-2460]
MKIQTNALNVLERTSHYLKSGLLKKQPLWYKVVAAYPPQKDLTRKVKRVNEVLKNASELEPSKKALYKTRIQPNRLKNKLYQSQKLKFLEDDLRKLFYEQHPWELADPKNLIENEKIMHKTLNWKTIRQLYVPLSGESVVQRTLYILENENLSLLNAYDKARFEYYRVKIEQESEENISKEESAMYGAVFDKSLVEFGFNKEQEIIEKWKQDAEAATQLLEARFSSRTTAAEEESGPQDKEDVFGLENIESFDDVAKS